MREYYTNEWFPKAYTIGVSWGDFWKMNPRIILAMVKAYDEKEKIELQKTNALMHLQGMYFAEAINSTVGNMFKKKTSKPHEYPKKPYELNRKETEFTEEELQRQREMFVMQFEAMKINFNLSKKKIRNSVQD